MTSSTKEEKWPYRIRSYTCLPSFIRFLQTVWEISNGNLNNKGLCRAEIQQAGRHYMDLCSTEAFIDLADLDLDLVDLDLESTH